MIRYNIFYLSASCLFSTYFMFVIFSLIYLVSNYLDKVTYNVYVYILYLRKYNFKHICLFILQYLYNTIYSQYRNNGVFFNEFGLNNGAFFLQKIDFM